MPDADFASAESPIIDIVACTGPHDNPPVIATKSIPAATFAALTGRSLRTLRSWDQAGLTQPEVRRSRRYYGAEDVAAVRALGHGRKGAREGSLIKYLPADWDNGT